MVIDVYAIARSGCVSRLWLKAIEVELLLRREPQQQLTF